MGSDSIATNNGSIPASKDFGKKKRTNRLAKLKQCKLDARREQWLSQVKNKGSKDESNGGSRSPQPLSVISDHNGPLLENPETRLENEGSSLHDSDLESLVNSPASSVMGGNDSRKDRPGSSCGSSISSSSSSGGCCSGNFSEEDEEDGCLDDWEAVADALTADEKQKHPSEPPVGQETNVDRSVEPVVVVVHETENKDCGVGVVKPECNSTAPRPAASTRAWRPDDAFRPQSLPNLSKQYSFPMNAERHSTRGSNSWARLISQQPTSCPICYEDLDLTDSSFLPCPCGFRLCLFCHKRILEADARCPGCRKKYDPVDGDTGVNEGPVPFRLPRSYSMNMRA